MDKYGEEYSGDSRFVADCRKLQSMYRDKIGEAIRPYKGRDGRVHYYGNYISGGEESGANFLTPYAFQHAKFRVDPANRKPGETIDADRLFNNLLSSQPMAFNLFCPLMEMREEDPAAATDVVRTALPDCHIHEVTEVALEFIPEDYETLTGDKSAMDAIIRFKYREGKEGFIAIETKYSENLGTNVASEKGNAKAIAMRNIRTLGCFTPEAVALIDSGDILLTQIYRNFLLSESYAHRHGLDSCSIILSPDRHPSTGRELASLSAYLTDEYKDKLKCMSLEVFVGRILTCCPLKYRKAFEDFYDRYLSFDRLHG